MVGGNSGEYRARAVLCARSMPRASSCGEAAQNNRMDRTLHSVAAALAEVDDAELHALIAATNRVPQTAPRLLAWIAGACDWELRRRDGLDCPLQPPEAAIPPEQETACIDEAIDLRAMFAQGPHGEHALFDALAELLTRGERKHQQRNRTA